MSNFWKNYIAIIITINWTAAAKTLQSCPTLCNPRDGSPPGSPVPGILQARTLEWVDISFSNAWKWKVKGKSLSRVRLLATPWTAAYQAPPSMGFCRQEYWSGMPLPSPINWTKQQQIPVYFPHRDFRIFFFFFNQLSASETFFHYDEQNFRKNLDMLSGNIFWSGFCKIVI